MMSRSLHNTQVRLQNILGCLVSLFK